MKQITTLIITLLALASSALAQHGMSVPPAPKIADADTRRAGDVLREFASQLDLSPLDRAAVQTEGRIKSFDSMAHEIVGMITGHQDVDGGGFNYDFLYLDMMIRPEIYQTADIIYIKNKTMRLEFIKTLLGAAVPLEDARQNTILKTGLVSESLLRHPASIAFFESRRADLIRTAKFVNQIDSAVFLKNHAELGARLKLIPHPTNPDAPWFSVDALWEDNAQQGGLALTESGFDTSLRSALRTNWADFEKAWRNLDADAANRALADFCAPLATINPAAYPSTQKLSFESMYFKNKGFLWVWLVYLLASVFLLGGVIYKWKAARILGLSVFTIAFLLQTAALLLRWYVSGRWPNSNMFEAVTTAFWFGALLAIGFELIARRSPMRNMFALTGAVGASCAIMAAKYIPQLDANITNRMPVLNDIWLYIHTNVIIASYALIFMASVTALLYLARRFFTTDHAYARAGGAAALLHASGADHHDAHKTTLSEVLDGATMILMELAFVMLWAGLIMGAIWADHSWGRPWGWDPKEVFALNTFLIFLILVHVRLKVRDKGFWTAILAVAGCAVMLFNWIVINFIISGLHSYA